MKVVRIRLTLHAALLAIIFSVASRAEETAIVSQEAIQAKVKYCETCHGLSGQGNRGSPPVPRLAGQETIYIENQLKAFAERRRDNKYMDDVSHALSPEMRAALAKHFRDLNPNPLGGAPSGLVVAGKKIYEEGVPDAKVVRCTLCHGPTAQGDGFIPRLAGQLNDYVVNKLVYWNKQRGLKPAKRDASSIMEPIVHGLTKSQIEAVAAYLSYLE